MNKDSKLIFEAYQQGKKKIDPKGPGSALEQNADLMSEADRKKFIESGHDLVAVKKSKEKKPIKESTGTTSVDEINAEMNAIFQQHGITPGQGSEAFWNAVEDVLHIDRSSGKRLQTLAKEWETAFARENTVKPHLQPPV